MYFHHINHSFGGFVGANFFILHKILMLDLVVLEIVIMRCFWKWCAQSMFQLICSFAKFFRHPQNYISFHFLSQRALSSSPCYLLKLLLTPAPYPPNVIVSVSFSLPLSLPPFFFTPYPNWISFPPMMTQKSLDRHRFQATRGQIADFVHPSQS